VRNTGEIFELIENIKEISENINFYIPIYFGVDAEIRDVEFSEKYEVPAEYAGREVVTDMKNSARL
jgi:hypothetical protein